MVVCQHAKGFNPFSLIIVIIGQEDYGPFNLSVTFTPDEFEKSVRVLIFNDTLPEDSETFYGNLRTSSLQLESLAKVVTAAATIEISYSDCKSLLKIWCMEFLNLHISYVRHAEIFARRKLSPNSPPALIMGENFVLY